MKKFTWLVFSLFFAVCGWADNIKMVSYFPIPYASYSDLKVTDTCDVGLMNECILDVQNLTVEKSYAEVPNDDLNTGALFFINGNISLKYTGTSAPSQISSENLIVGDVYETKSRANLNVGKDLVIAGSFLTNDQTITSLYGEAATIKGLNLKGYNDKWLPFPKCETAGSNEISWTNLKINDVEGIYLICGTNKQIECDNAKKPSTTRTCNTCGTQSQTVTCNKFTGTWVESGTWSACSVSNSVICNCSKHPIDTMTGLTETGLCCDAANVMYGSSGDVLEQHNGGFCCKTNWSNATNNGDGTYSGVTCDLGGGSTGGSCKCSTGATCSTVTDPLPRNTTNFSSYVGGCTVKSFSPTGSCSDGSYDTQQQCSFSVTYCCN